MYTSTEPSRTKSLSMEKKFQKQFLVYFSESIKKNSQHHIFRCTCSVLSETHEYIYIYIHKHTHIHTHTLPHSHTHLISSSRRLMSAGSIAGRSSGARADFRPLDRARKIWYPYVTWRIHIQDMPRFHAWSAVSIRVTCHIRMIAHGLSPVEMCRTNQYI